MANTRRGGALPEPADPRDRNREHQVQIYGEPLDALLGRVAKRLGLTQTRIARTLGLSPPMLSQLMSGHRVKIGNPAAVQRLQDLLALAGDVDAGRVAPADVEPRLAEIAAHTSVVTQGAAPSRTLPPAAAARAVQGLLRTVADAGALLDAAAMIEEKHPEIARLLRVYGAGRTQDAIAHFESHAHLI